MAGIYSIPNWFFGYDIFLEFVCGIIAILIATYAIRTYNLTKQREAGLFGVSFGLISLSYFAWAVINLALVEKLSDTTRVLVLQEVSLISVLGVYSHILLFMAGLTTLVYMTCRVESPKMYSMLLISTTLGILFSLNKALAIYSISSIFMFYILAYYFTVYKNNKNPRSFSILVAFVFLTAANLVMIFGKSYLSYVLMHIFQIISFVLILVTFVKILQNGRQKKK